MNFANYKRDFNNELITGFANIYELHYYIISY